MRRRNSQRRKSQGRNSQKQTPQKGNAQKRTQSQSTNYEKSKASESRSNSTRRGVCTSGNTNNSQHEAVHLQRISQTRESRGDGKSSGSFSAPSKSNTGSRYVSDGRSQNIRTDDTKICADSEEVCKGSNVTSAKQPQQSKPPRSFSNYETTHIRSLYTIARKHTNYLNAANAARTGIKPDIGDGATHHYYALWRNAHYEDLQYLYGRIESYLGGLELGAPNLNFHEFTWFAYHNSRGI